MLNRDSSVKSTWAHCSGVQLRCSRGQCKSALTCAGEKGTQTTGRRANSPPSCSLRDTVWRDMVLPAAAETCDDSYRVVSVLRRLAHFNRSGDLEVSFVDGRNPHQQFLCQCPIQGLKGTNGLWQQRIPAYAVNLFAHA
ncbi:hypothetical protein AVEN_131201-1 [Araneus ventricosus]|uniref:Uncharacterized protein n=1 Tax=Araneus ventricosus TaxID=182803 RepID=A0A4Y2PIR8_ARAVE|nr:hypothetical protein AVEN_131201-1 [Araneus ventricosus]